MWKGVIHQRRDDDQACLTLSEDSKKPKGGKDIKHYLKILVPIMVLGLLLGVVSTEKAYGKYPSKPITFIIPFSAGGGTDMEVRSMSVGALDHFGQPWKLVNMPGASATLGWQHMLRQRPDGYTLYLSSPAPIIALLKEEKPPFSPLDCKVACFTSQLRVQAVSRPGTQWDTWKKLVSYVNKHPRKLTIGQSRAMILGAQYMFDQAGIADKVVWVPYSSGADATADLLGGHLDLMPGTVPHNRPLVPDKAVVVVNTSEEKVDAPGWEGVPNAKDLGYEGITLPRVVRLHPDTPDDIVDFVSEAMGNLLSDKKGVLPYLKRIGQEVNYVPRAEAEVRYKKLVEAIRSMLKKFGK